MRHFKSSISRIWKNPALGKARGLMRYAKWQVRSRLPRFPYQIDLSEKSHLLVESPEAANGCAALTFVHGLYDYDNMSLIRDLFSKSDLFSSFLDVGGNIGVYALLASENENARVVTFEPHPQTAALLQKNLNSNHRDNVDLVNAALSATECELNLIGDAGDPKNQLAEEISKDGTTVTCFRADDWCRENEFFPDVVKIDVEGHEAEVLKGMGGMMPSVKLIFLEENIAPDVIAEILPSDQFLGPIYMEFEEKRFGKPTPLTQDACYVKRSAIPEFIKCGYRFPEGDTA